MIDTIIFDLDGTLLDTLTDLTNSVNYALKSLNEPLRTSSEVRTFVGDGYKVLMERACTNKDLSNKALCLFNDYYKIHLEDNTAPYDGIIDQLTLLYNKGYKMAIVSNKGDEAVKILCKKFFYPYIKTYIGVSSDVLKKPAPDMLNKALQELNSKQNNSVMIGDGEADIDMSKACDMKIINVTYGFRSKEQLKNRGGSVFIDNPNLLCDAIEKLK